MADAWAFLVTRTTYRNGRVRWVRVLRPGAAHCSWSPAKLAGDNQPYTVPRQFGGGSRPTQ